MKRHLGIPKKMTIIFLILWLVNNGNCEGRIDPDYSRKQEVVWPTYGINLCGLILDVSTRSSCMTCFEDIGSNWIQASGCVSQWLPYRFAKCSESVTSENADEDQFNACLIKNEKGQWKEFKRARVLYNKGGEYMAVVGDSKLIPNGAAAIYSCMAQELLFNIEKIREDLLEDCRDCFSRFVMDPNNEKWHLHKEDRPKINIPQVASHTTNKIKDSLIKHFNNDARMNSINERSIHYAYGAVGNDIPFHGIGPIAVDRLKGQCILECMQNDGDLDDIVRESIEHQYPVAAWIFQSMMDKITTITLPQ